MLRFVAGVTPGGCLEWSGCLRFGCRLIRLVTAERDGYFLAAAAHHLLRQRPAFVVLLVAVEFDHDAVAGLQLR